MILVVDDHVSVVKAMVGLLKQEGQDAIGVTNGGAAIDFLNNETKPSLIILDGMMPDMDGLEVLGYIRSNPHCADVPVVMYSADPQEDRKRQALALGAQDFILKAECNWEALRARLEMFIAPGVTV